MISGGLATIYVSDMDRAVRFYSEVLGLRLAFRFGNQWAMIEAGPGLTIGLHPASPHSPAGRPGSITIGLQVTEPIQDVVATLTQRGVRFRGAVAADQATAFAHFTDPDGNELYLSEVKPAYRQREAAAAGG